MFHPHIRTETELFLRLSHFSWVLLIIISFGQSASQAQPRRPTGSSSQSYRDLQREYLDIRREYQQLEDKIRSEKEEYYQRTKERFDDLKSKLRDMLWDIAQGNSPNRMPELSDLGNLIVDYGKYVGATGNDIIDLRTAASEIDLRIQKANQRYVELSHDQRLRPREPLRASDIPLPLNKPANWDELDDALDLWGFKELGDRYFDGRPEAWERFLSKHPEYKRRVRPELAPEDQRENIAESDSDDGGMYIDDDRMDLLGYMMEGEKYFANRPAAWEQFKKNHPDYKNLTLSGLAESERLEMKRSAIEHNHRSCASARNRYQSSLNSESESYSKVVADCNKIEKEEWRTSCLAAANSSHTQAVQSINREWLKSKGEHYCGCDDDFSRDFDRRYPPRH